MDVPCLKWQRMVLFFPYLLFLVFFEPLTGWLIVWRSCRGRFWENQRLVQAYWKFDTESGLGLADCIICVSSGNEIGPFRAVEESTLAHLTPSEDLPDVFAWYSLLGTAGTALGQLICGWLISSLQVLHGWAYIPSCRVIFLVYAGIGLVKLILTLALTHKVETEEKQRTRAQRKNGETQPLLADAPSPRREQDTSPNTGRTSLFSSIDKDLWSLVIRLFILFGIDSFASGLASLSVGLLFPPQVMIAFLFFFFFRLHFFSSY